MRFQRTRYIPANSCKIQTRHGVVYTYKTAAGRPAAVAYAGAQTKSSWHHNFKDEARREAKIREFFLALADYEVRKIARRAEASKPHTLKAGAIIVSSWGYDQTNVDWYAVVGVTANFVSLRPIASQNVPDAGVGPMSGHCSAKIDVANPDPSKWGVTFTSDKVTRHRVSSHNSVNFRHGSGREWDGRPVYESWYA
jgi:hypothetical protein